MDGNRLSRGESRAAFWVIFTLVLCMPADVSRAFEAAAAGTGPGQEPVVSAESQSRVRSALAAVGLILVRNDQDSAATAPRPRGSGVVVSGDGLVITSYHVIKEDNSDRIYPGLFFRLSGDEAHPGGLYPMKVARVDASHDLALLRAGADNGQKKASGFQFPAIEIGDSDRVQLLDEVIVVGFPEKGGDSVTVNTGVVEGTDRIGKWIKTDARLIHGNSGGAAVDSDGKLIGIPTKVLADVQHDGSAGDPNGVRVFGAVGYLRPSRLVMQLLSELKEGAAEAQPSSADSIAASTDASPPATTTKMATGAAGQQQSSDLIVVRGIVRSGRDGKAIAGARVGLVPVGSESVTASNLITWGGTDSEGRFEMNRGVATGRYNVRARALGYEPYAADVDIGKDSRELVIELRPSS